MSKKKSIAAASVLAAGAIVAMSAFGATAANADPIPPTTFSAVGSDTIQDLYNGLANGYGAHGQSVTNLASWNAFIPGVSAVNTIQTKVNGNWFNRPTGSGAGVIALSASNHTPFTAPSVADPSGSVTIQGQVDIARSSSGPSAAVGAGTANDNLTFVPLARDAVAVATKSVATTTFSTAQLRAIFTCTTLGPGTAVGNITINATTGDPQIVTVASPLTKVQLNPKAPQSASGTLGFFLKAIGTGTTAATLGSCVNTTSHIAGSAANTLQENHADELTVTGDIAPFSAAQWIAQKNGISPTTFTGTTGIQIKQVNGVAPVAGTTVLTPGALYGNVASVADVPAAGEGVFNRDVYSVIATAATGALRTLVTSDLPSKNSVITDFGFKPLNFYGGTAASQIGYIHSNWTN